MFKVGEYAIYTGTSVGSMVKSGEIVSLVDSEYLGGSDEYDLVFYVKGIKGSTSKGIWIPPTLLKELPEGWTPHTDERLGGDSSSTVNITDNSVRFDYILPEEYWR